MWGQNKEYIESKLSTLGRGYVKIDLDAIENNMLEMQKGINPDTKILGVVKTNAYGHGAVQVGKILETLDCAYGYAVASYEEAVLLREAGLQKPIVILGYSFPYCYQGLLENDIRPAVFREDSLEPLCKAVIEANACKSGADSGKPNKLRVHIKVDTGMGRIGIRPDDEGLAFVKKVIELNELEVEGIFTHFAKADEYDKTSVNEQIKKFKDFCNRIENELGYKVPLKHCSNSAGILELPDANMDMVRAGITMYGLMPSDEVSLGKMKLTPVMSLYSHISYIKTVRAGESVSYGGLFTAKKDTLVATVPVGYGDGYPRMLSGKGYVIIKGVKCPILGRVCMDQFMVDVSKAPGVQMGDEVLLMGKDRQSGEVISAEEIGNLSGRFNYELVCLISDRIPRVYYYKNEPVYIKNASWN